MRHIIKVSEKCQASRGCYTFSLMPNLSLGFFIIPVIALNNFFYNNVGVIENDKSLYYICNIDL